MNPGVHINGKASIASVIGAGGSGSTVNPSVGGFRGQCALWKFLGYKDDLDWLKKDLNAVKIITVQDYKRAKN